MARHEFVKKMHIPRSAHDVFVWHEQPGALEKLIPPTDPVRVLEHRPGKQGPIGDGARVVLELGSGPVKLHWIAVHEGYVSDREFVDVQEHGPFAYWRHRHVITPAGEAECVLEDHVEYELPMGALGDAVAHGRIRAQIERMFGWRHRATWDALVRPDVSTFAFD